MRQVPSLLFIIFLDSFSHFLVLPVFLLIFVDPQYSILPAASSEAVRYAWYSAAMGVFSLAFLVAAPLVGYCSDRFGRRPVLLSCLALSIVSAILPIIGLHHGWVSWVLLGRVITGVAAGSQPVAQAAVTDLSTGKQKAYYLSLIALAMTLALILGPLCGAYLVKPLWQHGVVLAAPYWLTLLLACINLGLLSRFFHFGDNQQQRTERMQWAGLLKNRQALVILSVFFLLELAWSLYYQSSYLVLGQLFDFSAAQIGVFASYAGVWMAFALAVIYKFWLQHSSLPNIARYHLLLCCLGLAVINVQIELGQWLGVILLAIGTGIAYAALLAWLTDITPKQHQGSILGFASTLLATAWMLTAFASGPLVGLLVWLPYVVAWLVMSVSVVLLLTIVG